MGPRYSIGDHIRYEYSSEKYGVAVIRAVKFQGWDYVVELDHGCHGNGSSGHRCNGYFTSGIGYFLNDCHVTELLYSGEFDSGVEIPEEALRLVLDLKR